MSAVVAGSGVSAAPRLRAGAAAAVPLTIPVAIFGVSFGLLARESGFSVGWAVAMSATTFAGSAQFVAGSVLAAGGDALAAIVAALMMHARYVPMGISVAPALTGPRWLRFLQAQAIVDESWALSHAGGGRHERDVLLGAGAVLFLAWNAGTFAGIAGFVEAIDPMAWGFDVVFPALFLSFLVPRLVDAEAVLLAISAGIVTVASIPLLPTGLPILAAGSLAFVGLRAR